MWSLSLELFVDKTHQKEKKVCKIRAEHEIEIGDEHTLANSFASWPELIVQSAPR